jgi:hypothetical protein
MEATLFKDKEVPGQYRVEAIDGDGGCEVAVFSGPNAHTRAAAFASGYYDEFEDETD